MDREYMCRRLPEKPPKGLISWARTNLEGDTGGDYTIFRGERIRLQPELEDIMENVTLGKSVWAAYCSCTACGESYYTQKVPGKDAFYIAVGEDETTYAVRPENEYDGMTHVPIAWPDQFYCPCCGSLTTAVHAKDIRGGRTKRVQVATLHAIDGYAVIVYWLIENQIFDYGCANMCAAPRYAYVLGEQGGLHAYSHRWPGYMGQGNDRDAGCWRPMDGNQDRWNTRYKDWGSINSTKVGTALYTEELPSLIGTTGEKTGLLTYWNDTRDKPVEYLKLWKKWKPVENLVNAGFSELVESAVKYDQLNHMAELRQMVDITKRKPHEMLRMTKADFREVCEKGRKSARDIRAWSKYVTGGGTLGAARFFRNMDAFGQNGMEAAADIIRQYGDCDLEKLCRYMEKQGRTPREVRLLKDTREMYREVTGRRELTEEERWPRHLQETHDRLSEQISEMRNREKAEEYQAGFDKVLETYGAIQWTDGELAIILPKCNGDLRREGTVLKHCVGGYGLSHSQGVKIILFVRHYRRPERSYYTLNISFAGSVPEEIQLHGYGNERHGDHKQYRHHIPQKVRQFVDRWEKEILLPWWREQKKKERKTA